jgi:hypothetical protein
MPPKVSKPSDAELVTDYMNRLEHPLKSEMEAIRIILKNAHPTVHERIKWNAPSYYTSADLVTFNHRMTDKVHLIFHHIAIVQVASPFLEGEYKDRRMMYFKNMDEIKAKRQELERIMTELIRLVG